MTAVTITYIFIASEGFKLSTNIGYPIGLAAALLMLINYVLMIVKRDKIRSKA